MNIPPQWNPPENWLRFTSIEAHTAGEPLRVITSGFPELPGDTILAKRRYAREHYDHLRTALMWEPRGHADMYGCLVTPPVTPDGALCLCTMKAFPPCAGMALSAWPRSPWIPACLTWRAMKWKSAWIRPPGG